MTPTGLEAPPPNPRNPQVSEPRAAKSAAQVAAGNLPERLLVNWASLPEELRRAVLAALPPDERT
jgi:hypothetical protein